MSRWLAAGCAALAAACATRGPGTTAPAPTPAATAPAAGAPTRPPERRTGPAVVRYGPSALRYLVHRRFHIEQSFGGSPQVQDLGAQFFVSTAITGPADTNGYPATFTVDSIIADSGTPPPLVENFSRVRALVFSGRLAAQGEFRNSAASDSALARNLTQLLGSFHDFLPRIPREGVTPGAAWSDTVSWTQRGGGAEVTRRTVQQSSAAAWEDHNGTRSLRVEASGTYSVAGSGQNGGQFFQIGGTGTTTARAFLAEDGRFIGGEARDSASLTLTLPAQGLTIPVTQLLHSTITLLRP